MAATSQRRTTATAVLAAVLSIAGVLLGPIGALPARAASPTELPWYVANNTGNSITEYAPDANGDATPIAVIAGPHTGLNGPNQLAVDSAGNLYVVNINNRSVTVYPPGSNGDVAPIRTIAGPHTGLTSAPEALAVDAAGNLYVANFGLAPVASVLKFAPGANGDVAPIATISGPNTGLRFPASLAIDAAGNIYVLNFARFGGQIATFAPNANGNVAPIAVIAGPHTGLVGAQGLALDSAGNLYAANTFGPAGVGPSITVYAAGANGDVPPIRTIAGSNTRLLAPDTVAVSPSGVVYVGNFDANSVTEYAPGANGNVAPIATVAGPHTGLSGPGGLAFATNCTTVVAGSSTGRAVVASSGTTCVAGATVAGAILVQPGATLLVQGATIARAISVSSGATLVVQRSTLSSSIRVSAGGSLSVQDSTIGGSIGAEAPRSFALCGSTVRGSVRVIGATNALVIGAPTCAPNTILGGVLIQ